MSGPRVELRLIAGESNTPVWRFDADSGRVVLRIGAGAHCNWRIQARGVRDNHLMALWNGARLSLIDAGAGDAWIDGIPLRGSLVVARGTVRLGDAAFEVRGEGYDAATALGTRSADPAAATMLAVAGQPGDAESPPSMTLPLTPSPATAAPARAAAGSAHAARAPVAPIAHAGSAPAAPIAAAGTAPAPVAPIAHAGSAPAPAVAGEIPTRSAAAPRPAASGEIATRIARPAASGEIATRIARPAPAGKGRAAALPETNILRAPAAPPVTPSTRFAVPDGCASDDTDDIAGATPPKGRVRVPPRTVALAAVAAAAAIALLWMSRTPAATAEPPPDDPQAAAIATGEPAGPPATAPGATTATAPSGPPATAPARDAAGAAATAPSGPPATAPAEAGGRGAPADDPLATAHCKRRTRCRPRSPEEIAADLVIAGRYREALPRYRRLAADHPDEPAYAAVVTVLEHKVAPPCGGKEDAPCEQRR
ncbi:MAG: hypothetical protein D6689_22075 [Deltaproteobacteria bacterium]|nr:MAG: hypothetical protein D6689_22075 [Deltaproteobacteria bacterium]